jgi:hypothetical protein
MRMSILLLMSFFFYSCTCNNRNTEDNLDNFGANYFTLSDSLVYFDSIVGDYIYLSADKLPLYSEGNIMFINDIMNSMGEIDQREYQERVNIAFVIDSNGFITGERIVGKKEKDYTQIEKQVLVSITKLKDKKWMPAEYKGKHVSFLMKPPLLIKYHN